MTLLRRDRSLAEFLNLTLEPEAFNGRIRAFLSFCSKSRANFAKQLETKPGLRSKRARFPRYNTVTNHCAAAYVITLNRLADGRTREAEKRQIVRPFALSPLADGIRCPDSTTDS